MIFKLPEYQLRELDGLMVCSLVPSPAATEKAWPKRGEKERYDSRVQTEAGPIWIRLILNRQTDVDGLHVHIDSIRESRISEIPKQPVTKAKLLQRLQEVLTGRVFIHAKGRFSVPRKSIPETSLVSLLLGVTAGPEGSEMKLTGSKFQVETGPVTDIVWWLRKRGKKEWIVADVESHSRMKISANYLNEVVEPLRAGLGMFILEESEESNEGKGRKKK